ncbi:MAG: tetratricopeptide repeat protein [Candidatus Sumerlaeia bacterium]|nr:tetratricopeptide repeat protein [Candidatus Sumerlaeia bacterium]
MTTKLRVYVLSIAVAGLVTFSISGCANQASIDGTNPLKGDRVGDLSERDSARLALATAQELEKVGRYPEAIAQYERARMLDKDLEGVARQLAVLYDLTDRYSRSQDEYAKALRMFPEDATLMNDYGYFLYRRGKLELSEEYLVRATEMDPFMDRAWINLGVTLAEQGRYKEALLAFEQVRPEPEALQNLGTIMARQGLFAEAREALEEAIRLDSNLVEARLVLEKIDEYEAQQGGATTQVN